jgi:hypothetical protein
MGEFMRVILLAGLALATAACGGGETEATDANTMATDNMMMDSNMMMDGNMMMDANGAMMDANGSMTGGAMNGAGTMGNGAMDANSQNMMMKDATTNDPDTNLANGM